MKLLRCDGPICQNTLNLDECDEREWFVFEPGYIFRGFGPKHFCALICAQEYFSQTISKPVPIQSKNAS